MLLEVAREAWMSQTAGLPSGPGLKMMTEEACRSLIAPFAGRSIPDFSIQQAYSVGLYPQKAAHKYKQLAI